MYFSIIAVHTLHHRQRFQPIAEVDIFQRMRYDKMHFFSSSVTDLFGCSPSIQYNHSGIFTACVMIDSGVSGVLQPQINASTHNVNIVRMLKLSSV